MWTVIVLYCNSMTAVWTDIVLYSNCTISVWTYIELYCTNTDDILYCNNTNRYCTVLEQYNNQHILNCIVMISVILYYSCDSNTAVLTRIKCIGNYWEWKTHYSNFFGRSDEQIKKYTIQNNWISFSFSLFAAISYTIH